MIMMTNIYGEHWNPLDSKRNFQILKKVNFISTCDLSRVCFTCNNFNNLSDFEDIKHLSATDGRAVHQNLQIMYDEFI